MRNLLLRSIFCAGIAVGLFACLGSQDREKETALIRILSLDDVNVSLRLTLIRIDYSFPDQPSILLKLDNQSEYPIAFPPGFGPRGYIFNSDTKEWIEIENLLTFGEEGRALPPKGNEITDFGFVDFIPHLDGNVTNVEIRLIIVGNPIREGVILDEEVGAYIDVRLEP